MLKLYSYMLNGSGRGKRYLLLLAVIFAAVVSLLFYATWSAYLFSSEGKTFLEKLPALSIENGEVTQPADVSWEYLINVPESISDSGEMSVVIDTTQADFNPLTAPKNGLYLTRSDLYFVKDGTIYMQSLQNIDKMKIKQNEYMPLFKKSLMISAWTLWLLMTVSFFIVLYLWSLFYAVCSYVLTVFIPGESYSFPVRRRLSVVSMFFAYLVLIPISFLGLYPSLVMFFVLVLIFEAIFLAGLPKNMIITVDK